MLIHVFSSKSYDEAYLTAASDRHRYHFHASRLDPPHAVLARGADAVCIFVNDMADEETLAVLAEGGVRLVLLRCAGFNNVDLAAAERLSLAVARVPAYSPHAVAEHTIGLILALNRKLHRAYNRVRESNFALEGLLGFDMFGKTVGVVGTGAIGTVLCRILLGFGCKVIASDPSPSEAATALGIELVALSELLQRSDIISLHCPLTPQTFHMIDADAIAQMRPGVMLINTSRGGLVDTKGLILGLKSGRIGALGLDVYEEEADLFFENFSDRVLQDDVFARLLTFPNVLITGHQAFFTHEALSAIASTTIANADAFEDTGTPVHQISAAMLR